MKKTIELLKEHNELKVIDKPLDIFLEIPHVAYIEVKKEDSKALLFTNPIDKRNAKSFDMPVLMNLFGSYERTNLLFGRSVESIAAEVEELLHLRPPATFADRLHLLGRLFSLKNVFPKKLSKKGACQEMEFLGASATLYDLPVLTTWSEDGGPFITMGQVYTQSLDGTIQNLGMYRLQVYDKNHLGMHWQIHKDSSHFFWEYQRAGVKMPVCIAIGGDPLYTWCATAPLPYGVNELLLYGFIKNKNVRLVKSKTTPLWVPEDSDIVIEGWVDPKQMRIEGPFGDHTGYYTLPEPYPVLEVSAITRKKEPVFLATVVGKPPLEDKYMGWATERIFLPLLKTNAPDLIDYHMPENGVFHNLIIAKMRALYPGHAQQFMHAFWGSGQMSFVKHAIFVGEEAPKLTDYEAISDYILNRVTAENILVTEGITDALDHSSNKALVGGKLGIDCTGAPADRPSIKLLGDNELLQKMQQITDEIVDLKQYKTHTKNPICVVAVSKRRSMRELFGDLMPLYAHLAIIVFVDRKKNDITNPYMLIWRVSNNIDAKRDLFIEKNLIGIDGTTKNELDGFMREWPSDVECDTEVVASLVSRGIVDADEAFLRKFQI